MHTVSAMDTLFVSQIAEGVRRYTAKRGRGLSPSPFRRSITAAILITTLAWPAQ